MPLLLIAIIQLLQFFPGFIEKNYTNKLYIIISGILRTLTGWCSFSLGDIFYAAVFIIIIVRLVKFIINIFKRKFTWKQSLFGFLKLIRTVLWLYILFNFIWGLNYHRAGIAYQLKLEKEKYTADDLCFLTDSLIQKTNASRKSITLDSILPEPTIKEIFAEAEKSYEAVAAEYPFLKYKHASIKKSLYSNWAAYFGFTGYYNPFSGEAQVRYDIPRILIPYIVCHEIAHQLGYASEEEANFVGYLAASHSTNKYFQYSVYMDLYRYSRSQLFKKSILEEQHLPPIPDTKIDSLVRKDLININIFFRKEDNKMSPIVMNVYDAYLKSNHQLKGIESYDEVTAWLLAYHKKYGRL